MAALLASKMPVGEASAVLEHLTEVKLPRAILDREGRRQGERAQQLRRKLDEQACGAASRPVQAELVLEPYQMIIQMDAWNIRERDQWGRTRQMREAGQEPERWHWVYTGTCFRRIREPKRAEADRSSANAALWPRAGASTRCANNYMPKRCGGV